MTLAGPIISALLGIVRGGKWCLSKIEKRGEQKALIKEIHTYVSNHTKHHDEWLEPTIVDMKADISYIRGWIDGQKEE